MHKENDEKRDWDQDGNNSLKTDVIQKEGQKEYHEKKLRRNSCGKTNGNILGRRQNMLSFIAIVEENGISFFNCPTLHLTYKVFSGIKGM